MRRPHPPREHPTRVAHVAARLAVGLIAGISLTACIGSGDDPSASAVPRPDHPGAAPFAEHCASCHGADLRGTDQGPSHLSWVYEPGHHPDWSFELAVREGVRSHHWNFGNMAPIEGLTDDEVAEVIAYVRAVQDDEGFEPYPPPQ